MAILCHLQKIRGTGFSQEVCSLTIHRLLRCQPDRHTGDSRWPSCRRSSGVIPAPVLQIHSCGNFRSSPLPTSPFEQTCFSSRVAKAIDQLFGYQLEIFEFADIRIWWVIAPPARVAKLQQKSGNVKNDGVNANSLLQLVLSTSPDQTYRKLI